MKSRLVCTAMLAVIAVLASPIGASGHAHKARDSAQTMATDAARDSCTVTGTDRRDVLRGTTRRDVICGRGGDDVLLGRGGHDRLLGGKGNDQVRGGRGSDVLEGASGWDVLRAGRHDDELVVGGPGHDRMYGGSGSDHCLWGWDNGGNDALRGGPGLDRYDADAKDRVSSAKSSYSDGCGPIGTPPGP